MECMAPHSDEDYRPKKPRIRPPRISSQMPKPMVVATGPTEEPGVGSGSGVGVGSTGSGVMTFLTGT